MKDHVVAVKNKISYVCQYQSTGRWKCGNCLRGVILVHRNTNGQGFWGQKKCKVCKAKISVVEVSR